MKAALLVAALLFVGQFITFGPVEIALYAGLILSAVTGYVMWLRRSNHTTSNQTT